MKRKVIQLAGKTSVISLPSKWVKRYNISKGEELEVEERGDELVIKTKRAVAPQKFVLDAKPLNERTLRWTLSGLHKYGYDEIEILYSNEKTLKAVNDMVKNLFVGFAVIDQSSKKCSLRRISSDVAEEFDPALRRAFLVTLSLANSSWDMIREKEFKGLKNLMALEQTNNQLTNFCQRILSRESFLKDALFKYVIIWNLEKIADDYKYICKDLGSAKEIHPSILEAYGEVNDIFKGYYHLFYKFSTADLKELGEKKEQLARKLGELKPVSSHEKMLLNHLSSIVSKCADFSTSIFVLHHQP